MKIRHESELLDQAKRAQILQEITNQENVDRRKRMKTRYDIYKDKTKQYVLERLRRLKLKEETITMMDLHSANVSIAKKIVNKKAKTYAGGASRTIVDGNGKAADDGVNIPQASFDLAADLLCWNDNMRKSDRYLELFRNSALQLVPVPDDLDPNTLEPLTYKLIMRVLAPWQYDVIEDYNDREKPMVYILSDFWEEDQLRGGVSEDIAGRHPRGTQFRSGGDNIDQAIADNPSDANKGEARRRFIWWSENYHFTTDAKGAIIEQPDGGENPIEMLPFVNLAQGQDGQFWAEGGSDIIEGSILINMLLTDMFTTMYIQGYGQMVMIGKQISKREFQVGPNQVLLLDHDDNDDPPPSVNIVHADPRVGDRMNAIEQYVALMLSTNDLAPSTVAGKLDARNAPSGIAMIIEQSEVVSSIEDKQNYFADIEAKAYEILKAWNNLYQNFGGFNDYWAEVGSMADDSELTIEYNQIKPIVSEREHLEALEKRKNLGINSLVDLIMIDNPSLSEEQAEQRALAIQEEKMRNQQLFMADAMGSDDEDETNDDDGEPSGEENSDDETDDDTN